MSLEGKTAFITGAGRAGKGIGRSIALALAAEGANIAIADYVAEAAESVAEEARKAGVRALAVQGSVADSADVARMVAEVQQEFGAIDILVNNAGITRDNLAKMYQAQGQHARAMPLYQRALTIHEKAFGPNHPIVARNLENLADTYRAQNQYPQAEVLYQRAVSIFKTFFY